MTARTPTLCAIRAMAAAVVALVFSSLPARAPAQAWVPADGEGSLTVVYQNYYTLGHHDLQGRPNTNGATHAKSVAVELDYGLTDTVALVLALPFIASKYTGPDQYFVAGILTTPGPLDDRRYHGAIQDLRAELRKFFEVGRVAVTPFVGLSIPTHAYEVRGEAVPGRRRPEFQVGVHTGADLDDLIPRTYVQFRYALAAAPPKDGFEAVRSLFNLESGIRVFDRVALRGLVEWQLRNRGPLAPQLAPVWEFHDRFIIGDYCNVGGGLTLSLRDALEMSAVWMQTVRGKNGAHRARLLTVGVTWSFGGALAGFGPW